MPATCDYRMTAVGPIAELHKARRLAFDLGTSAYVWKWRPGDTARVNRYRN
jgi:hypothetical protein